ncbi:MAG: methionyl-tRNA formyltransferase [Myxococcota bacterium]|jgi:methionyl-tRNA formyltransferase|nr:methionyl-tRNA formyltransferase [Myxococcota bacterium]
MRILFFGTPEIAVPSLERLIAGPFDVVGVVSQPDRRRGRGRKVSPSPVSAVALREDIPLFRPEKVASVREELEALSTDMGVVVAFGQFLPKSIRELPRHGYLINAHASLLPKYRGAAPINHAILEGEHTTGVSVMRVDREMDAGPVALTREIEIGENETAGELTERMGELAATALEPALQQIDEGTVVFEDQDHTSATEAGKLTREMGELHWSEPAETLVQRIRAFAPKPGAFTHLEGDLLRIYSAHTEEANSVPAPGTIAVEENKRLRVATGKDWLVPERVQRAGGKEMPVDAFLRGREIATGSVFDAPKTSGSANG